MQRRVSDDQLSGSYSYADIFSVEFATVGKTKDGRIYHHLWGADEIMALLKEHDLAKEENPEDVRVS